MPNRWAVKYTNTFHMFHLLYTVFLQWSKIEKKCFSKCCISKNFSSTFVKNKNPHLSGPAQFRPVVFKGQLYRKNMHIYEVMIQLLTYPRKRKLYLALVEASELERGKINYLRVVNSLPRLILLLIFSFKSTQLYQWRDPTGNSGVIEVF